MDKQKNHEKAMSPLNDKNSYPTSNQRRLSTSTVCTKQRPVVADCALVLNTSRYKKNSYCINENNIIVNIHMVPYKCKE